MALICELPLIANPMRECCFHWKPAQICKPHNSRSALPQKQLASMIAKAIQKPPFLGTQKWSGHLMGVFVCVFGCRLPVAGCRLPSCCLSTFEPATIVTRVQICNSTRIIVTCERAHQLAAQRMNLKEDFYRWHAIGSIIKSCTKSRQELINLCKTIQNNNKCHWYFAKMPKSQAMSS